MSEKIYVVVKYSAEGANDPHLKATNQTVSIFEESLLYAGSTEQAVRKEWVSHQSDGVEIVSETRARHDYDGEEALLIEVLFFGRSSFFLIRQQEFAADAGDAKEFTLLRGRQLSWSETNKAQMRHDSLIVSLTAVKDDAEMPIHMAVLLMQNSLQEVCHDVRFRDAEANRGALIEFKISKGRGFDYLYQFPGAVITLNTTVIKEIVFEVADYYEKHVVPNIR